MKNKMVALLLALVVATPSIAQKISIDYASDFDFESAKTFTYVAPTESKSGDPLMDQRIEAAVLREMRDGRLTQVDSGGDLNVTWGVTSKDNTVFNTTHMGYGGYGAGWRGYGRYGYRGYGVGMGTSTTTASTYTKGTLIIDAYEPGENKLVWRGTGRDYIRMMKSPEETTRNIHAAIDGILADFPPGRPVTPR